MFEYSSGYEHESSGHHWESCAASASGMDARPPSASHTSPSAKDTLQSSFSVPPSAVVGADGDISGELAALLGLFSEQGA